MAPPSTTQELVTTIINIAVFKSILRYINDLRAKKRVLQNMEESPSHRISLGNTDNQIHLLNDVFLQICSSLSSCVEGLSFNCYPVTLDLSTAVSFIEGGSVNPRRGVVEPEPRGEPSYLPVAASSLVPLPKESASKLKEITRTSPRCPQASFLDTPIRISISTLTPHDLASTIINDLVFKCIVETMTDLLKAKEISLPRNKSLDKIIGDQRCLLGKVMSLICSLLEMLVEGVSILGPEGILGACTSVAFIEGCYVKEKKKPELRGKPTYLSVAKGREPLGPLRCSSHGY